MTKILELVLPLFIIIFLAAVLQKRYKAGDEWSNILNSLALNIGFPVLIFSSLVKSRFSFADQSGLLMINSLLILGSFALAYMAGKLLRLKNKYFRTFFLCLAFGNTAYLGIPVLTQVFGENILPTASIIVAVYLFWLFTAGTGFLEFSSEKASLKNMVKELILNPLLIAVFLGITISTSGIQLPAVLMESLDMITASVTPTVLIVIGLFIGKSKIGNIKEWIPVFLFSAIKIAAIPLIFFLILRNLNMHTSYATSIIESAMPLAITPFAMSQKFGLDKEFIARSIVLSTILSVITLPFWISAVK